MWGGNNQEKIPKFSAENPPDTEQKFLQGFLRAEYLEGWGCLKVPRFPVLTMVGRMNAFMEARRPQFRRIHFLELFFNYLFMWGTGGGGGGSALECRHLKRPEASHPPPAAGVTSG